jgi:hypothetical protein
MSKLQSLSDKQGGSAEIVYSDGREPHVYK